MKNYALIEARKSKGYTQEKLAKELGYKGKQAVSNWENGTALPPLIVALRIGEILGKDLKELFFTHKVQISHTLQLTGS